MVKYFLLSFILLFSIHSVDAAVRPQDFGLLTAKNGKERYMAIYKAHKEANRLGTFVDYRGIDSLSIEIPQNVGSIPIDDSQNFKGLKLIVKNNVKDHYLFTCKRDAKDIEISQDIIDGQNFRSIPELKSGVKLLLIRDGNPWVEKRAGYSYGAERRDVMLLINGIAQNKAVMPYGNKGTSQPICRYAEADLKDKKISNLTFIRAANSKYMTFLFAIGNINNIELSDIRCFTPTDDSKYGDRIFVVEGSTNVTYRNIYIDGMYTQPDKYGYGISMNNIWNVKLYNVRGKVSQGIICNSNINQSYLKDCNMNRYDIHCYGRDATMQNCTFEGMYFPVASFYGKIIFKRCTFVKSQPVWIRADYNAYVPFDIELYNCSWHPVKGRDSFCYTGELNKAVNSRSELKDKNWPSVKIRGLHVFPSKNMDGLYIYKVGTGDDLNQAIGYMPFVDIEGLKVHSPIWLDICNKKIKPLNRTKIKIKQKKGSLAVVRTETIN